MPKKAQSKKSVKKSVSQTSKTSPTEFSIERIYNTSRERVWRALTSVDEMRQWYFDLPDFQPHKDFEFQFLAGKDSDHLYKHLCKVTEVIPDEKLSYSWQYEGYKGYSEVTFELFSEGSKTKVKLTHTGINTFPQDNDDLSSKNFAEGWTYTIGKSLKEYVEKRKIIMFNFITLDGFFEGSNPWELDWHNVDAEFNDFAVDQLHSIDAILFGKNTYEGMANFWPTPEVRKNDPIVAKLMNDTPKYVFSKSLQTVKWENSLLLKGNLKIEISSLKTKIQKDAIIMGSGELTNQLIELGLVDELRVMINPIILGNGKPLFSGSKHKLKLVSSRQFKSGNILLYYHFI